MCSDTTTKDFWIYPEWKTGITIEPKEGCAPLNVHFNSDIDSLNYYWKFGDGNFSMQKNASNLYQNHGVYTVLVNVSGNGGCVDSLLLQDVINVFPVAIADFDYEIVMNPTSIDGTVVFSNNSQNATTFYWEFDDGSSYAGWNTTHRFMSNGCFDVELYVNNEFNCPDSITKQVCLDSKGLFIPNAFSPGFNNPLVSTFQPIGIGLDKYLIEVYDTWGNLLWLSDKVDAEGRPSESWDGKVDGKLLPMDAYVWRASALFKDGSIWQGMAYGKDDKPRKYGSITLIK